MKSIWLTAFLGLTLTWFAGCDRGQVKVSSARDEPSVSTTNSAPAPASAPAATTPPPAMTESKAPNPQPSADTKTNTQESPMPISTPNRTNDSVALIKTSAGEMVIEFWPDIAPKTVANFQKLASEGFYDGTCFHRIVKDFMIQGGDPLTKDPSKEAMYGTGNPGYTVPAEFNDRSHQRGVISMARSQDPNSAGSQFFICLGDASFLDRNYTAFGHVIKGDDVLGKIGDTPVVSSSSGEQSKPTIRVEVQSIKLVDKASVK